MVDNKSNKFRPVQKNISIMKNNNITLMVYILSYIIVIVISGIFFYICHFGSFPILFVEACISCNILKIN